MTTGNEDVKYTLTHEELQHIFARTDQEALAKAAMEQHAREWPSNVDSLLSVLVAHVVVLTDRVAALETQLTGQRA